jgi:flavin-dependent dehydrogenase
MNGIWDVLIVGGGSAGSAVAFQCARRGLSTLLLEKGDLGTAGAHWVNGVSARQFDAADLARPVAPELRAGGHRFHLFAGHGPDKLVLPDTGVLEVDMRHLIARLQREARAHGAVLRSHAHVLGRDGACVVTRQGVERARFIIDATGLGGLFFAEKPRPTDVCAAAQGVYAITDVDAARAWFADHGAEAGDTVCFASVAGGYSILSARLEFCAPPDTATVEPELAVLTGTLPALGNPSGRAIRDDFARSLQWVGPMRFGGQAPIPLHRPHRRLAFIEKDCAVIRVGDAAGQVYAAHGSGIGAQLIAGKMLADALMSRDLEGARRFERDWHRRFGAQFIAADLARRLSTRLSGPKLLGFLMRHGLLPQALVTKGLEAGL